MSTFGFTSKELFGLRIFKGYFGCDVKGGYQLPECRLMYTHGFTEKIDAVYEINILGCRILSEFRKH